MNLHHSEETVLKVAKYKYLERKFFLLEKTVRIFRFDKAGTISRAKDISTTEKLQEAQRYNNWANVITASRRNIIKYFNMPCLGS